MLNIDEFNFHKLLSSAVEIGIHDFLRGIDPEIDRISRTKADSLVRFYGYMPSALDKWTEAGLLHPFRHGKRKWYSWSEIKKRIYADRLRAAVRAGKEAQDE